VVYDFCIGRGAKFPVAFLKSWNGTLLCDDYKADVAAENMCSSLRGTRYLLASRLVDTT
jgi:hypothetical protein